MLYIYTKMLAVHVIKYMQHVQLIKLVTKHNYCTLVQRRPWPESLP